jgi:DNA-binding PadR family transcriptional regulator
MKDLARVTAATIDVLRVLVGSGDPTWGLQIIKQSGRPAGSVYPILDRLERLEWVSSEWERDDSRSGPRRRFYQLTAEGARAAAAAIARVDADVRSTKFREAGAF